jgi:hypothetical protein
MSDTKGEFELFQYLERILTEPRLIPEFEGMTKSF